MRFLLSVFVILANTLSSAHAIELSDSVTLRGFGTLGATSTTADKLGYRSSLSSSNPVHDDSVDLASRSLLGLQADILWNQQLSSTLQLVFKDRPEDTLAQSLQLATLNYTPNANWQVQFGRFAPRAHLLTEYRNVGFGYLWTEPAMEFYGPIQSIYIDGIALTYKHPWQEGFVTYGLDIGTSETLLADENTPTIHAKLEPIVSASLRYEDMNWQLNSSLTYLHNSSDWEGVRDLRQALSGISGFWPEANSLADKLVSKDTSIYFMSLGADYSGTDWGTRAEISAIQSDSDLVTEVVSGYVSVSRYLGDFTPYVRLAHVQPTNSKNRLQTAPPAPVAQLAYQALAVTNIDFEQSSFAAGVRWDFHPNMALKLQWERSWLKEGGAALWWNGAANDDQRRIDTLMLNLDFTF